MGRSLGAKYGHFFIPRVEKYSIPETRPIRKCIIFTGLQKYAIWFHDENRGNKRYRSLAEGKHRKNR